MKPTDYDGYRGEGYGVEDGGSETEYSQSHAPPTMPGEISQARFSSSWPTVFGVIGIIISAWGLLMSGCRVLVMAGIGGAMGMGGSGQFSQQMQTAGLTGINLIAAGLQYAIGMGLAVYLLIASISLIKRSRSGARHMVLWSWIRIVAFAFTTVLGFATANYSQMNQQMGGQGQSFVIVMAIGGILLSAVLALWFPVLNLIWFRRAVIRDETEQWM